MVEAEEEKLCILVDPSTDVNDKEPCCSMINGGWIIDSAEILETCVENFRRLPPGHPQHEYGDSVGLLRDTISFFNPTARTCEMIGASEWALKARDSGQTGFNFPTSFLCDERIRARPEV